MLHGAEKLRAQDAHSRVDTNSSFDPQLATQAGLEIGAGKKRRLIPWSQVLDIREMPTVRFSWFSNPSMWQVDLDRDEQFDFCGTPKARQIVRKYIARADGSAP